MYAYYFAWKMKKPSKENRITGLSLFRVNTEYIEDYMIMSISLGNFRLTD